MWPIKVLYDISIEVSPDMQVYKGKEEKKPKFKVMSNHENASTYETSITFDMHTGTHIDAPLHMIKGGETMEYFQLENIFTNCLVVNLTDVEDGITIDDLKKAEEKQIIEIMNNEVVLLQTKNSYEKREKDFIYLAESGAEYLIEKGVIGVGIDTPGIERAQEGHPTHRKLLSKKIFIVEGLYLKEVLPARYKLMLVPLKIRDVEAAPARAFLLEINDSK